MSNLDALVGARVVVDGRPTDAIAGSVILPCTRCGHDVWISPSGQNLLAKKRTLEVICLECMGRDPDAKIAPPRPEQIEEIREHYRR